MNIYVTPKQKCCFQYFLKHIQASIAKHGRQFVHRAKDKRCNWIAWTQFECRARKQIHQRERGPNRIVPGDRNRHLVIDRLHLTDVTVKGSPPCDRRNHRPIRCGGSGAINRSLTAMPVRTSIALFRPS